MTGYIKIQTQAFELFTRLKKTILMKNKKNINHLHWKLIVYVTLEHVIPIFALIIKVEQKNQCKKMLLLFDPSEEAKWN